MLTRQEKLLMPSESVNREFFEIGKGEVLIYYKMFFTAFFWGGTWIAAKKIAYMVDPYSAAFLRFMIASVFLVVLVLRSEGRFPVIPKKMIIPLILLGTTGVFAYNLFFFHGLQYIDAGRASLIVALIPISIAIFSGFIFKEKMSLIKMMGIVISLIGAVIVISNGRLDDFLTNGFGFGELFIFGGVLCWTAYTIIGRKVLTGFSPLTAVCYSAVAGTIFLFLLAGLKGMLANIPSIPFDGWAYLFFLGFFGTVVGFIWYYEGLIKIGPAKTAVFINFVPVCAIVLAYFFLGENLSISLLVGGACVLSGVYITNASRMVRMKPSD